MFWNRNCSYSGGTPTRIALAILGVQKALALHFFSIGQFAENVYFGKPCGLMDQMACSVGSLAHINFQNPAAPLVERIEFDLDGYGYSLCITDTKAHMRIGQKNGCQTMKLQKGIFMQLCRKK